MAMKSPGTTWPEQGPLISAYNKEGTLNILPDVISFCALRGLREWHWAQTKRQLAGAPLSVWY